MKNNQVWHKSSENLWPGASNFYLELCPAWLFYDFILNAPCSKCTEGRGRVPLWMWLPSDFLILYWYLLMDLLRFQFHWFSSIFNEIYQKSIKISKNESKQGGPWPQRPAPASPAPGPVGPCPGHGPPIFDTFIDFWLIFRQNVWKPIKLKP